MYLIWPPLLILTTPFVEESAPFAGSVHPVTVAVSILPIMSISLVTVALVKITVNGKATFAAPYASFTTSFVRVRLKV